MAPKQRAQGDAKQGITTRIENDPTHHLTGPFMPQTPLDSNTPIHTPTRGLSPALRSKKLAYTPSLWSDVKTLRWAVDPLIFYANWAVLTPFVDPSLPNPFASLLFISHPSPNYTPERPLYQKGFLDIVFVLYNILFFSFVRQFITLKISHPIAKSYGIKRQAKLDRFGEQFYAVVYFSFFGLWGLRIMKSLPTWWYRTEHFWLGYPDWEMSGELKRYYLMQMSYWMQQLIVLILGLEKPRKDYHELVAHHFVTLWLVCWSYLVNLTLIGNAVYMSMDIPDVFLAFSKILNYLQYDRAKIVSFAIFAVVWGYFRHWLNLVILWSVWTEFKLIPDISRLWDPLNGKWMPGWLRYQIFLAIAALQVLNIFWYYLILRILIRALLTAEATDERSDDEDDDEEPKKD